MKLTKKLMTTLVVLMTASTMAASQGTLHLKGSIPENVSIEVNGNGSEQSLDLTQTVSQMPVGNVSEVSNAANGYKVSISSTNKGKLVNGNAMSEYVSYTLHYGDQALDLSSDTEVSNSGPNHSNIETKDLKISYTGSQNLTAGDYTDSVMFTIAPQ